MSNKTIVRNILYARVHIVGVDRPDAYYFDFGVERILEYQSTNIISMGSAKLTMMVAYRTGETWMSKMRAMDRIEVKAAVVQKDILSTTVPYFPIFTGYIDEVSLIDDPVKGSAVQITASTVYKLFEVTTETKDYATKLVIGSFIPGWQVVSWACDACGIPQSNRFLDQQGDLFTSPQTVVSTDTGAMPGINHQYRNWANILGGVCQMVGRELFADEIGNIRYRLSHFSTAPVGEIPTERLITPTMGIDADIGIANRVQVRYTAQEYEGISVQAYGGNMSEANWPAGYPVAHYRDRMLIVAAPWIQGAAGAQWYADWILAWAMNNSRPGQVVMTFSPEIKVGNCYIFPWPGRLTWYVQSVVHHFGAGMAPQTLLGLAYGRDLSTIWFDITNDLPALGTVGPPPVDGPPPAGGPPPPPSGNPWSISQFQSSSNATGVNIQQQVDGNGNQFGVLAPFPTFHIGSATVYPTYWVRPGDTATQNYQSLVPAAFDPTYIIPELSVSGKNVSLSPGDQIQLLPSGVVIECRHQNTAVTGRSLDLFGWNGFQGAFYVSQTANYLAIQQLNPTVPPVGNGDEPVPSVNLSLDDMSTQTYTQNYFGVAQLAVSLIPTIGNDSSGANRIPKSCFTNGPPPTNFDNWLANVEYMSCNAQCVVFVRYCLLTWGFPAPRVDPAASMMSVYTSSAGWTDVTGQAPQYGDVLCFGPGADGTEPSGHVAIVVGVVLPSINGSGQPVGGYVTVAQTNCLETNGQQGIMNFPVAALGQRYYVQNLTDSNGNNIFGPQVQGIIRYLGSG